MTWSGPATVPVRQLPESMRWDIERCLKAKLSEEDFLALRPRRA